MCAACVAQGAVYVGGALTTLQLMAARARSRRDVGPTPPERVEQDATAPASGVPSGSR